MESLAPRRQALIERTTSALLRIISEELQAPSGERGEAWPAATLGRAGIQVFSYRRAVAAEDVDPVA